MTTRLEKIAELLAIPVETPESLAIEFCELDDDQQARFFVEVAKIMSSWNSFCRQSDYIGLRLRAINDYDANEMLKNIVLAIELEK